MRARWLVLALLLGCATGSEIGEDGTAAGIGGHGTGFGGDAGSGSSDGGSHSTSSSSGTSSSTGGEAAGGSDVGGSGSGGSGNGGAGAGGGSSCNFISPNACSNAQTLNSVAGDDGGTATTTGVTSKWLAVHVTEEDGGLSDSDLSYTATLTSPPGMVYNLVIHQGGQDAGPNCGAPPKAGSPPGGSVQTVHDSWDDDQPLGGEDDSVWISIEVVYVSGDDCLTPWNLQVQGGT